MTKHRRPSLYDAAEALLGTKDRRKIDRNTYLERRDDGAGYEAHIALRYHETDVMRLCPSFVELDSGGWHTVTTWERMSTFGLRVCSSGRRAVGIVVYPVGSSWDTGGFGYYDGIRLTADGTALLEAQPNFVPFGGPVLTRSGWNGMTRAESRETHSRLFESLQTGDAAGFADARSRLAGTTQTLQPVRTETVMGHTADVYEMSHEMIGACPHFILVPDHYRADGTCRCDDATHSEMREWGYTWNDTDGRWN